MPRTSIDSDTLLWWATWIFFLALSAWNLPIEAAEGDRHAYQGSWLDTGIPTDGPMSAGITDLGDGKWNARFTGIWEGRKFDYVVEFAGTPDRLQGEARINAAKYVWEGKLTADTFTGRYRSNRGNDGTWTMKRAK